MSSSSKSIRPGSFLFFLFQAWGKKKKRLRRNLRKKTQQDMKTKEMNTAFLHSFKYQPSSCRSWTQMQQGRSTANNADVSVRIIN